MRPTLVDGERILVECLTPRLGSLSRGAVVVLEPPGGNGERYVKRIVGLPGDIVRIGCGTISVNGEPCLEGILTGDGERIEIVPEEAYFVVGDNADHSFDSRLFGAVPEARVVGRVVGH
jgi:signal peptidase I